MSIRAFRCRNVELNVDASRDGARIRLRGNTGESREWETRQLGTGEFGVRESGDPSGQRTVFAVREAGQWWLHVAGRTYHLELATSSRTAPSIGELIAPIPGTVTEIAVSNGDDVEAGQVVMVISAMKMQLEIKAPHAGMIQQLDLAVGDPVDAGRELLRVDAPDV